MATMNTQDPVNGVRLTNEQIADRLREINCVQEVFVTSDVLEVVIWDNNANSRFFSYVRGRNEISIQMMESSEHDTLTVILR